MKDRSGCKLHKRHHSKHENMVCWIMVTLGLNSLDAARKQYLQDWQSRTREIAYLRDTTFNVSEEDGLNVPFLLAQPKVNLTYNVEEEA